MILAHWTGLAEDDILDAHSPEGQEAFQFLLATAMHRVGKFELLNVAEVDGQRSEKLIMLYRAIIITVYEPDPDRWIDFRRRI
jgi:hypothetical protein